MDCGLWIVANAPKYCFDTFALTKKKPIPNIPVLNYFELLRIGYNRATNKVDCTDFLKYGITDKKIELQ